MISGNAINRSYYLEIVIQSTGKSAKICIISIIKLGFCQVPLILISAEIEKRARKVF